jgi:hypothetical protein
MKGVSNMAVKQVNMRLGEKTLAILEEIKNDVEAGSRAQAVAYSARVMAIMLAFEKQGSEICVKHKNGDVSKLVFLGSYEEGK